MVTEQPVMWEAIKAHLARGRWMAIDDVYRVVRDNVPLDEEDAEPVTRNTTRWQRNVRNILQYRRTTFEIFWSGAAEYMLPDDSMRAAVDAERVQRLRKWGDLRKAGASESGVSPKVVRAAEIYAGGAGIYADRTRTSALTNREVGVTIGLLHNGSSYPDDIGDDGVVYHYPTTQRPGRTDANEIEATKWAARLGLPIFVITAPPEAPSLRRVRLAHVVEWSDREQVFLVSFGEVVPPGTADGDAEDEESEFVLEDHREGSGRFSKARRGQAKFKFDVVKRYGWVCAVCDIGIPQVIEGAHILPKGKKGSDDPRNGLSLCATHHRAFDSHLFAFDPETFAIRVKPGGPTMESLRITQSSLQHLPKKPHVDALRRRWERFSQD